jgi:hypothetical protein
MSTSERPAGGLEALQREWPVTQPSKAGKGSGAMGVEKEIMDWANDPNSSANRTEPKFKVGQIVIFKGTKKSLPFRILEVLWFEEGWFYRWNKKNAASEHMLRELTDEEKGA